MGPQLDSCGRPNRVHRDVSAKPASMGPQLDSCGRYLNGNGNGLHRLLQWGRNLTVAEGGLPQFADPAPPWLQWGRNLTVAEGCSLSSFPMSAHFCFNGAAT